MKRIILPIFVPHMGCPCQCVFCNQFHITGHWAPPALEDLRKNAILWQESSGAVPELAFYGGSFTAIDADLQNRLLGSAAVLKREGLITSIRLSTRPDAIDKDVLERLYHYGVETIEIGVQSLSDEVLLAAGRGHTAQSAKDAIELVKSYGFTCGVQMMLALPADTIARSIETCREVIALAPDFVRIYPTVVLKDTALAQMYESGEYTPWPMEDIIDTVAQMADMLQIAGIPIIRIGLQPEDNLTNGEVIAGAYHPALGELVAARRFRQQMCALIKPHEEAPIEFAVASRDYSKAVGQHRENIHFLEERTKQKVTITRDDSIAGLWVERR